MKKTKIITLVLMITLVLNGCGNINKYNVYERLYNCYNSMHSFKAKVAVTMFSNNSENKYTLTQYYKSPDKQRSEYVSEAGSSNITVINGETGKIVSDFTSGAYVFESANEPDYLMLSTFFDLYYSSEETSVKTSGGEKNSKITLNAETGSSNPYRNSVELVVDCKTLNPLQLKVKDNKGKTRICVDYLGFELNPKIDDKIFE